MRDQIRAVIFDLGDTLIRTPTAHYEDDNFYAAVQRRLREVRPHVQLTVAQLRSHQGCVGEMIRDGYLDEPLTQRTEADAAATMAAAMQKVAPQYAADYDLLYTIYGIGSGLIYSSAMIGVHTATVLTGLRERGYKLGLCSNYFGYYDHVLASTARMGIVALLDATVFSCETGWRKPNPASYAAICDRLAVQPQDCLFVGDRLLEDVHGPQALGMRGSLTREFRQEEVPPDAKPPDLLLGTLDELLAAL